MSSTMSKDDWKSFWASERENAYAAGNEWLRWALRQYGGWKTYSLCECFRAMENGIMARGKAADTAKKPVGYNQWTDFVDIPLAEDEWGAIYKAYSNPDVLADAVTDLLEAGYRVGMSHNRNNDAFIVSVTCKVEGDVNEGLTFNSFAETWFEALQIGMYKHYLKSGKNWKSAGGKAARPKFG